MSLLLYEGSAKLPGGHFYCSIAETSSEPFLLHLYFLPIHSQRSVCKGL